MMQKTESGPSVRQRIFRRGKHGRYYIDLRDLGKDREALIPPGETYATKDEMVAIHLAGKRIAELEAEKRGQYFGGLRRTATLGAFAREWFAFKRSFPAEAGFTDESTIRRYEQAVATFFKVFDQNVRMDHFTKADAKKATAKLSTLPSRSGGTLKAASINQAVIAMRQIFEHAKDEGVVPPDHNPWSELRPSDRPKLPKVSSTDFLEVYEAAALLEACPQVTKTRLPLKEIVATFLLTGGRKLEVLGLEVADIDFTRKVIHFHTNRWRKIKTRDRRTVPIWPQLEEILRPYMTQRAPRSGLVFPSEKSTDRYQVMISAPNEPIRQARNIAAAMLGGSRGESLLAKQVTPRALRPTYCSARLQTLDFGRPIAETTVYFEMGHGSEKMIKAVYGRLGRIRHRGDVVEYRLEEPQGSDAVAPSAVDGTSATPDIGRAAPEESGMNVASISAARGLTGSTASEKSASRRRDLPVTDSHRPGRVRLEQFLTDAGVSKVTFMTTHRRDAELMKRLDVHFDFGGRLHFPEAAGRELRAIRNRRPHGNKGRPTGRVCGVCEARVATRLTSCSHCGEPVKAEGR